MMHWRRFFFLCFCLCCLVKVSAQEDDYSGRVFHQIYSFQVHNAFQHYKTIFEVEHNHELLRRMAQLIISQDSLHSNIDKRRLAVLGAGISATDSLLPILEKSIKSPDLLTQKLALKHLAYYESEYIQSFLEKSLSANQLDIVFEAAQILTNYNNPFLIPRILQIRDKLPPRLFSLFTPLLLKHDSSAAESAIRQMIHSHEKENKLNTLSHIAHQRKSLFLPEVKNLLENPDYAIKEASLHIIGNVQDHSMIDLITTYLSHHETSLRLAAAVALTQLGETEIPAQVITKEALQNNLFAIDALSLIDPEYALPCLHEIMSKDSISANVRQNALLSLLHHKDKSHLHELFPLLLLSSDKCSLQTTFSPGKRFKFFSINMEGKKQKNPSTEQAHLLKIEILQKILKASPSLFVSLTKELIEKNAIEVVPLALQMLHQEHISFDESLAEKAILSSSGLIRTAGIIYANQYNLAKYSPMLKTLLFKESLSPIISFQEKMNAFSFQEEMIENSKISLYLEGMQILLKERNDDAYSFWVNVMSKCHPYNHGILSGLFLQQSN
ncbi:hypothetical protein CLAVI_000565 [Candidatus Clavichlamydia salmonicola]|uniref:HEAT repeat domain-containing protein n=1 Tax=Candidatus Clavichlamydia salmonicola TaxID=469812 RepID=UPI001890F922|nr:HEAT repeat domain-containing protein [Candidatus Clavichlamydia salmonicola]MBF5050943.1 hypothetical protein [Candidatus Clavichlamydia salmonicola]